MAEKTNLKTWLGISIVLVTIFAGNVRADGTYSGGTGEPNDPYLISTPADMNEIGAHPEDWNDCFLLTADTNLIDYNETNFIIIGNDINSFTGTFNGNGHTISNFTFNSPSSNYVGLFGYVNDPNAKIENLILIDPNIQGYRAVGALAGWFNKGTITGCAVEGGNVSGYDDYAGCLAGYNHGNISNCYATGDVTGTDSVGGLVGYNVPSTISNCYAAGAVDGDGDVGGLVGNNLYPSTISNCYATGPVSGDSYSIGGLVGDNGGTISNCYAMGSVTGDDSVGGLVGKNYYSGISNCYATGLVTGISNVGGFAGYNEDTFSFSLWDTETSGTTVGAGYGSDDGVYGLGTELMKMQVIYDIAGWDFVNETLNGSNDVWTMHDGADYPQHVWELVNFIGWYEVDFADFAYLAGHWLDENCGSSDDCDGADLDFSDSIDEADLKIFIDHWLDGI